VATAFATLAKEQKWTRPVLNLGFSHRIVGGRHPIVETGLWERGQMFVKNDCYVGGGVDEGGKRMWVITGFVHGCRPVLMIVRIWVVSRHFSVKTQLFQYWRKSGATSPPTMPK
jgi:hypothetical protein